MHIGNMNIGQYLQEITIDSLTFGYMMFYYSDYLIVRSLPLFVYLNIVRPSCQIHCSQMRAKLFKELTNDQNYVLRSHMR